jgi:hypothetical protein
MVLAYLRLRQLYVGGVQKPSEGAWFKFNFVL